MMMTTTYTEISSTIPFHSSFSTLSPLQSSHSLFGLGKLSTLLVIVAAIVFVNPQARERLFSRLSGLTH